MLLLAFFSQTQSLSTTSVLSIEEQTRLRKTFQDASPFRDLETAHYAVKGLKFFKSPISTDVCKFVKDKVDSNSVSSIYHASSISKVLGNCPVSIKFLINMLSIGLESSN